MRLCVVSVAFRIFAGCFDFTIVDSESERIIYIKHYQNKRPNGLLIMMLLCFFFFYILILCPGWSNFSIETLAKISLAQPNSGKKLNSYWCLCAVCCVISSMHCFQYKLKIIVKLLLSRKIFFEEKRKSKMNELACIDAHPNAHKLCVGVLFLSNHDDENRRNSFKLIARKVSVWTHQRDNIARAHKN